MADQIEPPKIPGADRSAETLDRMSKGLDKARSDGGTMGKIGSKIGDKAKSGAVNAAQNVAGGAVDKFYKAKRLAAIAKNVAVAVKGAVTTFIAAVLNPYFWVGVAAVILVVWGTSTGISTSFVLGQNENGCVMESGTGGGIGSGSGDYNPGTEGVDYFAINKEKYQEAAKAHNEYYAEKMAEFAPSAIKGAARAKKETGVAIPVSVMLAQTIKESSAGKYIPNPHNYGGFTCYDGQPEACTTFSSDEEYFYAVAKNYATHSAYKHCLGAKNWAEFSVCVLPAYATAASPKSGNGDDLYVSQIAGFISQYKLDQYDGGYNVKPVDLEGFVSTKAVLSNQCSGAGTTSGQPLTEALIQKIKAQGYKFLRTSEGLLSYQQCNSVTSDIPLSPCTNVCDCGCGPTSYISAITALTGKFFEPGEIYKKAVSKGLFVAGKGASYNLPIVLSEEIEGVRAESIPISVDSVNSVLSKGGMVWTCGWRTGAPFTQGGHCVVIRGRTPDGQWLFFDSAGRDPDAKYSPSYIVGAMLSATALYAD